MKKWKNWIFFGCGCMLVYGAQSIADFLIPDTTNTNLHSLVIILCVWIGILMCFVQLQMDKKNKTEENLAESGKKFHYGLLIVAVVLGMALAVWFLRNAKWILPEY